MMSAMNDLNKKALGGLLRLFVSLAAALFLPAWTLHYWQAWIFLAVFFGSILPITIYLMKYDPNLLEGRITAGPAAEKEKSQKIIQFVMSIVFIATCVLPAIDHRFGWSAVPLDAVAAGDILVALGLLIVFLVFKENTFASGSIKVHAAQRVVSTGPYAFVRHPMYFGALVMLLGMPLSLGSWWGLLAIVPMTAGIVWRLLNEEKLLAKNLPGYSEYRNIVAHRLLPFVW
jgi:protein-S-isoprenylcysteine O-methyltransferase Ste14